MTNHNQYATPTDGEVATIGQKRRRVPSRRSVVSPVPSSLATDSGSEADDAVSEYNFKRSRNNAAVRKSRERSKAKTHATEQRLVELRGENKNLEQRVTSLQEELERLKRAFIDHALEQKRKSLAYDNFVASKVGAVAEVKTVMTTQGVYGGMERPVVVRGIINLKKEKEMRKNFVVGRA